MKRDQIVKVLFISLLAMEDVNNQSIYGDLLRFFRDREHEVVVVSPRERRTGLPTELSREHGMRFLRVSVGNIQKTGFVEKGISLLCLKHQLMRSFNKYLGDECFDLILFTTPPTTISSLIGKVKERTGARAYLLLKDIFPQNSLDLGLLSRSGIKGIAYRYFKKTERDTYAVADWIGCMSEANREYLLIHAPQIDANLVEVNPNSITPRPPCNSDRMSLRRRFELPDNERVFVYGGNLGKPQAIDFLIEVLRLNEKDAVGHFVIAGAGTERHLLEDFFSNQQPSHATLLPELSQSKFDSLLNACDAGLILLDPRFTIPNFPSRLLSYMQAKLPVLVASDASTDIGKVVEAGKFGFWCSSETPQALLDCCRNLEECDLAGMGEEAYSCLMANFTVERSYRLIMKHFPGN